MSVHTTQKSSFIIANMVSLLVHSFLDLVPYLFCIPGVKSFLSEKLVVLSSWSACTPDFMQVLADF